MIITEKIGEIESSASSLSAASNSPKMKIELANLLALQCTVLAKEFDAVSQKTFTSIKTA